MNGKPTTVFCRCDACGADTQDLALVFGPRNEEFLMCEDTCAPLRQAEYDMIRECRRRCPDPHNVLGSIYGVDGESR